MVRAPCCEKMGLKKGPWTPEEDQVLTDYIQRHGHGNWRALPKHAGLLRCGKSCRLRWMNYLRPDIKRGNFTQEEEETIISLHEKLGNRWSAIAARLPGRTDNEIKNVWHTHLKKRVHPSPKAQEPKKKAKSENVKPKTATKAKSTKANAAAESAAAPPPPAAAAAAVEAGVEAVVEALDDDSRLSPSLSRANSCSDLTSSSVGDSCCMSGECTNDGGLKEESISSEEFPEIDESFWMEVLSMDDRSAAAAVSMDMAAAAAAAALDHPMDHEPFSSLITSSDGDDMEFWSNVFMEAGGLQEELPQL